MHFKCDMHVHSRGAPVERVYMTAIRKGMNLVTITEMNDISPSIELLSKYRNVITGCEYTVTFEILSCHVLVYGHNSSHHFKLMDLRRNMPDFADFLHEHELLHSVAHIEHTVRRHKVAYDVIVEILEMFDGYEIANYRKRHTQDRLASLKLGKTRYNTAGSDAISLQTIGETYIRMAAITKKDFISGLQKKRAATVYA